MIGGKKGKTGGSKKEPPASIPTLADSGIDKKTSSRAQQLASVSAAEFEAALTAKEDLNPNRVAKDLREKAQRAARQAKRNEAAKAAPVTDSRIIVGDFRDRDDVAAEVTT